jgi:hypothetical protein
MGVPCLKRFADYDIQDGAVRVLCPRCGTMNEWIYRPKEEDQMNNGTTATKPAVTKEHIRAEYNKAQSLVKSVEKMQAQYEEDHRQRVEESARLLAETQAIVTNYESLYPWLLGARE